jgi:hypothetical protein
MNPTASAENNVGRNGRTEAPAPHPLPLWRLIAGIAVLAGFAAVIIALAPVYIENLRLGRYVQALATTPATARVPDETIRSEVLQAASQFHLPVHPDDVQITHNGGKLRLQVRYRVQMDLALYPVDLHFHPEANSR